MQGVAYDRGTTARSRAPGNLLTLEKMSRSSSPKAPEDTDPAAVVDPADLDGVRLALKSLERPLPALAAALTKTSSCGRAECGQHRFQGHTAHNQY